MISCSVTGGYEHFGGTCCLCHLSRRKLSRLYVFENESFSVCFCYGHSEDLSDTLALYIQDQDDLPFKKGEVLTVLSKDEEQWWTARNTLGQVGSIPVPYVQKVGNSLLVSILCEFILIN